MTETTTTPLLKDLEYPLITGAVLVVYYIADSFMGRFVQTPNFEQIVLIFVSGLGLAAVIPVMVKCFRKSIDFGVLDTKRPQVFVGTGFVLYQAVIKLYQYFLPIFS